MSKLFIIPTPIGNLNDFTLRSIEVLKSVKYILCEDTKITGKIKSHLKLESKLISLHKFNENSRIDEVLKLLNESNVALVSDAGTPTISDPGQLLIKEISKHHDVVPLPGANAITTALSGSGIEFKTFTFIGFLDKTEKKIIDAINKHLSSDVIVVYESPNRINQTLEILFKNYGDIELVVARELTKFYEQFYREKISSLLINDYKGEIVLLIPTKEISKEKDLESFVEPLIKIGMNDKTIVNYLTKISSHKKNDIYDYLKNRI